MPILVINIILSLLMQSAVAKGPVDISLIEKVLSTYEKQKTVEMEVTKTIKSELLNKKTDYVGKIWISKEKFRWETETPDKALIVFDGINIYSVQYPNKDLGGNIQVAKGTAGKKGKNHILISLVLKKDTLAKNFSVIKVVENAEIKTFNLKPKKDDLLGVVELTMSIDVKKQKIVSLEYVDDLGNKTSLEFGPVYFNKSVKNKDLFKFKVPKDAQVTEL